MTDINLGLTPETIQAMKSATDGVTNTITSAAHSGLVTDVLFITALNNSVVPTVIGGIVAALSYRWLNKIKKEHNLNDEGDMLLIGYVILCCVFVGSLMVIPIAIGNIWAWVGLFRPDLYAAHLAISIVTK